VAIDLPYGKNLVGAFYQPKGVLIDESTLTTLEEKFFIDGMAEAIKYGAIFSEEFFSYLELENFKLESIRAGKSMEKVIFECCNFKRIVVEEDEHENGRRALLNFGHTVGHGIEKVEKFIGHSHGEAVAIGMCVIAKAGEAMGVTQAGVYARLKKLLEKTGLPTEFPVKIKDEVVQAMGYDKKAQGSSIKLIMLSEIGKSFIMEEKKENLMNIIDRGI
jgi:3-dehydroquinate synthase